MTDNVVVLSACSPDAEAEETTLDDDTAMGLFTFALTQAMLRANPNALIVILCRQQLKIMSSRTDSGQTPQYEGQVDNVLFERHGKTDRTFY
ncbi:MAG: hypothetical protein IPL73_23565 [Candidatus Obscuribacter sp.]|nr:hypothetical protein [Candidatus Obscuribacter sp.]